MQIAIIKLYAKKTWKILLEYNDGIITKVGQKVTKIVLKRKSYMAIISCKMANVHFH